MNDKNKNKGQAGGEAQNTKDTDQDLTTQEDTNTSDDLEEKDTSKASSTDESSMSDDKGGEAMATSEDFEEDLDSDTYEAIDE